MAMLLRAPEAIHEAALRDALVLYAVAGTLCAFVSFVIYQTGSGLTRFFSPIDALDVVKAASLAVAMTCVVMFLATRLDNVSRTVPIIHFLLLVLLLIAGRMTARVKSARRSGLHASDRPAESILLIGVNQAAWLYIQMIDEFARGRRRIVAVLDDRGKLVGRKLAGHPVVGSSSDITRIIRQLESHGVHVNRIVLAASTEGLSSKVKTALEDAALIEHISVESLEQHLFGPQCDTGSVRRDKDAARPPMHVALERPYWTAKRAIEFVVSLGLIIAFAVPMLLIAGLVAVHLGRPVLFWQQRIGRNGTHISVQKFRSLREPVDAFGNMIDLTQRQTTFGRFMRYSRLDELPQLFSILVGTMSLIGPRPLLPADQPRHNQLRLQIAPGLTGWAQVCGGKLLSSEEKGALDDWYAVNASFLLDCIILERTARMMLMGERRDEQAIAEALAAARAETPEAAATAADAADLSEAA